MNPLKPLVFIRPVTQLGGADKSTIALVKEINKTRKVIVLDYYGCCREYFELMEKFNIEYKIIMPEANIKIIGGRNRFDRIVRLLKAYKEISLFITKLRKVLDEINPEAIWFSDDKSLYCVGRALEIIPASNTKTIMFIRGDIGRVKFICVKYWKRLHCIAGNNSVSLQYYKKFGWARNKLKVVYNGLDIEDVHKAAETPLDGLPRQNCKFKVVLPAMLIPLKAQDMAIRGFAEFIKKYDNTVLWLCGNTPNNLPLEYENSLKALVSQLGIQDKVFFLGWRKDIIAIMKQADVMILTSTTEGLPRSILEAMAVKTPVVSTKAGGIVDIIVDEENGMLIDIDDHKSLVNKLLKLTDKLLRDKIVDNATQTLENKFTINIQASTFLKCF